VGDVSNAIRTRLLEEIAKHMSLAADAAELGIDHERVEQLKLVRRACIELDRMDGKSSDENQVIAWVDRHLKA
jgi:hypothetical protein